MANYKMVEINAGDILSNATGTRKIRIIRNTVRNTKTQCHRVYIYSVLDKAGNVDYNDQKTVAQLLKCFPIKVNA